MDIFFIHTSEYLSEKLIKRNQLVLEKFSNPLITIYLLAILMIPTIDSCAKQQQKSALIGERAQQGRAWMTRPYGRE